MGVPGYTAAELRKMQERHLKLKKMGIALAPRPACRYCGSRIVRALLFTVECRRCDDDPPLSRDQGYVAIPEPPTFPVKVFAYQSKELAERCAPPGYKVRYVVSEFSLLWDELGRTKDVVTVYKDHRFPLGYDRAFLSVQESA